MIRPLSAMLETLNKAHLNKSISHNLSLIFYLVFYWCRNLLIEHYLNIMRAVLQGLYHKPAGSRVCLAPSSPVFSLTHNLQGVQQGPVVSPIWLNTSFSKHFITTDVKAVGLWSSFFREQGCGVWGVLGQVSANQLNRLHQYVNWQLFTNYCICATCGWGKDKWSRLTFRETHSAHGAAFRTRARAELT